MSLLSYVAKDRNGTYYFRRIIPPHLRQAMPPPWTGKTEWKLSLRTKDRAQAKRAASQLHPVCSEHFERAERTTRGGAVQGVGGMASLPLETLEAVVLASLLKEDEDTRTDGDARKHLQSREERAQWPDLVAVDFGQRGLPLEVHGAYGEHLSVLRAEYREALARADTRIVDAETRMALRQHGLIFEHGSEAFYRAGLAVLRAHVRAYDLMAKRQAGDVVETPPPPPSKGPKLSEALREWSEGSAARGTRRPAGRTLQEAEHAVRRFKEWHGDLALGDITREQARDFRDALAKLPTRLPEAMRRLPMRKLVASAESSTLPAVHATTVNKTLNLLSAIVGFAEKAGRLDAVPGFRNPFSRAMRLAVDERESAGRQIFTEADLRAIFETEVWQSGLRPHGGGGEAAYWLPLLGLLTGARLGELAQLRVTDLRQDPEAGVWLLDIGTAGGRRIKTASSKRVIPLHPELVRVGLLDYRAAVLKADPDAGATLWPGLVNGAEGTQSGAAWSKWFNRWLRLKAGIEDRGKVFHSFRHTFKRMARDACLTEEQHDALTGHAKSGGAGVGRMYGRGFSLGVLRGLVEGIEAPAVVRGLRWAPGVGARSTPPPCDT